MNEKHNNKKPAEKRSSVQKQITAAAIIAGVALIVAVLFVTVLRPVLTKQELPETVLPELLDGEELGHNNRILMYPVLEKTDIARVEIHNEYGRFAVVLTDAGMHVIEGFEHDSRAVDGVMNTNLISSLLSHTRETLSVERVATECQDWATYGLAEEDEPASFTVTTVSGDVHTVLVGKLAPPMPASVGGYTQGYYCRYEGRDALYILGDKLADTVLVSGFDYFHPLLTGPVEQNDQYSITDFILKKDGEMFVHINRLGEDEKNQNASVSTFEMVYPGNYVPSAANYESGVLAVLPSLQGAAVVAVGSSEKAVSPELLAEFGIDLLKPAYFVHYKYKDADNDVYFSAYDPALGGYYAYSAVYNQVVAIAATSVPFLEWDFIQYVDRPIIQMWIDEIGELSLQCGDYDETFSLSGTGETLSAKRASTGETADIDNLKRLVQVIYSLKLEDYAPYTNETLDETAVTGDVMTLTVTTRAGKVFEFVFYPYHTRRALYTVNGVGEFYVLRDQLSKILSDANKLLAGEAIDPYSDR